MAKGKSNRKIKELRINNCVNATGNVLKTIAENCPNIEVLDFHCSQNQGEVANRLFCHFNEKVNFFSCGDRYGAFLR